MCLFRRWAGVAFAALIFGTAGCGGTTGPGPAEGTTAVPATTPSEEPPTAGPTPSSPPPQRPPGTNSEPPPGETPEPTSEAVTAGPVSLSAVFRKTEGWEEDRFGIADRDDVRGWGVELNCYSADPAELELRLTHRFTRMTMQIGQGNDSLSSDQVVVVEIYKGAEQAEIRRITFDTLTPFDISAERVNAMTIQLYLDREAENCRAGGSVIAVVEGLTLT